ncbi:glycine betaine ABC transporter substrate-binding protein [Peptacetobacter hiranonis]|uniref:glycine betaine ABC transporter substrate-binding protein n=1 Tax=Peptacetobacter hiranonis TaxID=89152 RepID=UPI003D819113
MKIKKKLVGIMLSAILGCTFITGCESKSGNEESASGDTAKVEIKNEGDPIVLATMTDEESQIYGEIMKQVLESNGYEVDSSGVGTYNNSTLPRQSLQEGQVDLVMDYTGRGMMFIKDVDSSLYQKDFETAFNTTKDADAKNGLEWLCYSPYNNSDGICVKADWAKENNIKDFNDFAKYINDGGKMKIAIATENSYAATAPTCIPGLEKTYGFKLSEDQVVVGVSDPQSMVAKGTDGVMASHCYTTGGALEALGLYVIEDPEYVSPIYSPAAVSTKEFAEKYPEVQEIFTEVFQSIDEDKIRDMNKRLSTDGESAADIAKDFLQTNGFIK